MNTNFVLTQSNIESILAAAEKKIQSVKEEGSVTLPGRTLKNFPEHVDMEARKIEPVATLSLTLRGVTLEVNSFEDGYINIKKDGFSSNRKTFGPDYTTIRGLLSGLDALQKSTHDYAVFEEGVHAPYGIARLSKVGDIQYRVLHVNWSKQISPVREAELATIGVTRAKDGGFGDTWLAYNAKDGKAFVSHRNGLIKPLDSKSMKVWIEKYESDPAFGTEGHEKFDYWKVNDMNWASKAKHDAMDTLILTMAGEGFVAVQAYVPFDWEYQRGNMVASRRNTIANEWSLLFAKRETKAALRKIVKADWDAQDEINGKKYATAHPEEYPVERTDSGKLAENSGLVKVYEEGVCKMVARKNLVNTKVAYVHENGMKARDGRVNLWTEDDVIETADKAHRLHAVLKVVELLG